MKWTNTVETIVSVEQSKAKGQWQIGDAIKKDLALAPGAKTQEDIPYAQKGNTFAECGEKLEAMGYYKYGAQHLAKLYHTAIAFPRNDRNPDYSWDTHYEAGTPENLKNAATALRKVKKTVTKYNVRDIISHWSEEADTNRKAAVVEARAKKAKAKKEKAQASEEKLSAKDQAAKDKAEERRQEAQRQIEEAVDTIRTNGGPRKFNTNIEVDTDDIGALERWAVYIGVIAHTTIVKREVKKALKDLISIAKHLSDVEQQEIADSYNEIITISQDINELVKRPVRRLTVHQGGVA